MTADDCLPKYYLSQCVKLKLVWLDLFIRSSVFFIFFLAFGVAHQAVEEVDPSGDTILVQGIDLVFHKRHI